MKKRLLSLIIVLCMLTGLFPTPAQAKRVASGTCGKNVTWTLDSNGTLSIQGTGDMNEYKSMREVPWYSYREEVVLKSSSWPDVKF